MKSLKSPLVLMFSTVFWSTSFGQTVTVYPLQTNGLATTPAGDTLLATRGRTLVTGQANRLVAIDPTNGQITRSVFVGSEPTEVCVSNSGNTLYVVLEGAAAAVRVNRTLFAIEETLYAGFDEFFRGRRYFRDIEFVPGSETSIAATLYRPSTSPSESRLSLYDGSTERALAISTFDTPTNIEFGYSASRLHGNRLSGGTNFYNYSVSANGISQLPGSQGSVGSAMGLTFQFNGFFSGPDFKVHNGIAYSEAGNVFNTWTNTTMTPFPAIGLIEIDTRSNVIWFLNGSNTTTKVLQAYDLSTRALRYSLSIPNVNGKTASLVTWGTNGLAFRTSESQLFVIRPPQLRPVEKVMRVSDQTNDLVNNSTKLTSQPEGGK